ncbi:hypothetical protein [Kocuria palustris]|uniref:hypothetical protein n=1 Tax=Kocuria palustris TaxID=71999 RepID=UPI00077B6D37|nr:hypothetical protein [Kocuria palustris]
MTEQPEHPVYDQQDYQDILNALRVDEMRAQHHLRNSSRTNLPSKRTRRDRAQRAVAYDTTIAMMIAQHRQLAPQTLKDLIFKVQSRTRDDQRCIALAQACAEHIAAARLRLRPSSAQQHP